MSASSIPPAEAAGNGFSFRKIRPKIYSPNHSVSPSLPQAYSLIGLQPSLFPRRCLGLYCNRPSAWFPSLNMTIELLNCRIAIFSILPKCSKSTPTLRLPVSVSPLPLHSLSQSLPNCTEKNHTNFKSSLFLLSLICVSYLLINVYHGYPIITSSII